MKRLLVLNFVIAACAALCAPVWLRNDTGEEIYATELETQSLKIYSEPFAEPEKSIVPNLTIETMAVSMTEKRNENGGRIKLHAADISEN